VDRISEKNADGKMDLGSVKNWANENAGLIGLIALLVTVICTAVGAILWVRGRKHAKQRAVREHLENAEKWRKAFSDYLDGIHAQGPPDDIPVVIRDVMRTSRYPKRCQEKGISSFFKVWLRETYHSGILVGLGCLETTYIKAVEDDTNWYYCDHDDPEGKTVYLIGKIPFDRIEEVNWGGDEYDYCPHLYCRFDSKTKEPYDEFVYAESVDRPDSWPCLREIVRLQDMKNKRVC
jgi:hypothetical protein